MNDNKKNSPVPFSSEGALRIGPVVLAFRGATTLEGPVRDFTTSGGATPDLLLLAERGRPAPRPSAELLTTSRTGWDLYRDGPGRWLALKAIPYGSERVLRSVRLSADGGEATLMISPDDDRPEDPFAYTLSELLALLLTRVTRAMLVHSACVELEGKALLFSGSSGSGKSTMAGLWERSGRGRVLGDESHLLWADEEGRILVSGTPWPGSSGLYSNRTAPLDRIFFLSHGRENTFSPIEGVDGMLALLSHSFLPAWDAASMEAVADLASAVAEAASFGKLAFAPDERVTEYLLQYSRE